jgi:hypothetical protein
MIIGKGGAIKIFVKITSPHKMIVIKVTKILIKRMKKNGNNNELNGRPKGLKKVIDQEMFM